MRVPTVVVRGEVLDAWLTLTESTRSRLAADLGVSKGRISQLLTSREEPSAHLMAKLLTFTQLPFEQLFAIVHSRTPRRSAKSRLRQSTGELVGASSSGS